MSVIVALSTEESGSTWIGSDSLYCNGTLKLSGPKWIIRPPWAVGVAGHLRSANTIEHHGDDILGNLPNAYEFTRRVRNLLREDGFHENSENRGPLDFGQTFVLAHPDGVATIGSDFSITPIPRGQLWAEGSGRELALGAAHAVASFAPQLTPRDIVARALRAAIALDAMCGGDAWVQELAAGPRGG
jgi:hypothetical protein